MKTLSLPMTTKPFRSRVSAPVQRRQPARSQTAQSQLVSQDLFESAEPAAAPAAPKKLFYRIQEAAALTGLKPSVLRYWESMFRELHPDKDASDQRRYRQADIEVVQAIRKLLYEDRFTIKGARGRLRDELRRMRQGADGGARIVAVKPAAAVRAVAPKPNPAPAAPAQPSLTEFRMQTTGRDEQRKRRLNQSIHNLRSELDELLGMLS
jgi:DNA-binding transcriptional MerR regulator